MSNLLELSNEIAQMIESEVKERTPEKITPYVSWSIDKRSFYVSTTDDDLYDGEITVSEIADDFIDCYVRGTGGTIEKNVSDLFISELHTAIDKIKAATEQ